MSLTDFIQAMPKVELHVHLEGATQPETLLKLAQRHHVALPATTVDGIRKWFTFRDFAHFIDIYIKISECIRTPDDIEMLTRDFLRGQAAQNIRYSEVTYTAYSHYRQKGFTFSDQLAALNRARAWADAELGVRMGLVIDISRDHTPEEGIETAQRAISGMDDGVVALGLGGPEVGNPPEKFTEAFALAREAGLPSVPHAGETVGPESIWGALNSLDAVRIGHGVRCLEDPALVAELRDRQIPLEVCPTSNVCLGVVSSMTEHPLLRLLDEGLVVTLNSDDPPMFNTTLTNEYQVAADTFGLTAADLQDMVKLAQRVSFLPESEKDALTAAFETEFAQLQARNLA